GGAMTAAMLASYPEVFAAGAIVGGGPYRCADDALAAGACMAGNVSATAEEWGDRVRDASEHEGPWPRLAIWHGDEDATVDPGNAAALEAQWSNLLGLEPADVSVVTDGIAEVRSFT